MTTRHAESEDPTGIFAAHVCAGAHAGGHASTPSGACCSGEHATGVPFDTEALISARGLKVVRAGRVILSDVDLDIAAGEILTLIGPNGAGKTTLVRTLLGLERPDGGSVQRKHGLRIGYVPQRFDVDRALPMTVARFLSLGDGARRKHISDVLEEVGAGRVASQQLGSLSGGELQRVALARALLNDPELLVLDEPARGVDYVGEAELYRLIGHLRDARGLGVLLISHDLHVVMAQSDRVICLNRHVCCSGVPEAVAQHPAYVRLFGAEQARAFAVYQHRHDHRHDLAGETEADPSASGPAGGNT
ncbi:metal ABC transporter ATP-binding protein [Hyphomicrobium sp.]|uniref:metal ABC transporter ATP-binding protein n=1 Tax=Hyphomicrobium sp. TaxID=82 RepID=UPI002FDEF7ED